MKIGIIGGHLSPALAVIDKISKEDTIIFLGRKYAFEKDRTPSLEYQVVRDRGISFFPITTGRIKRQVSVSGALSLFKIPQGFMQAYKILRKERPDVVLGFGGYLSVPVCLAARSLQVPVVIHEQTLEAGLANKLLARFAEKICLSWEESQSFFPKEKSVITGNPLKKFSKGAYQPLETLRKNNLPLLYITGGSTGAHAINALVEAILPQLLPTYTIIHQTGDAKEFGDYDRLLSLRSQLPSELQKRYHLTKFIPPSAVGSIMEQADLIISRSGINTVTELLYFGRPALLIPLPYGQKNEQLTNAQFIKKVGLAEILNQETASPQELHTRIDAMVAKQSEYLSHAQKAREMVHLNAAEKIYEVLTYVVKKTSS